MWEKGYASLSQRNRLCIENILLGCRFQMSKIYTLVRGWRERHDAYSTNLIRKCIGSQNWKARAMGEKLSGFLNPVEKLCDQELRFFTSIWSAFLFSFF